MSGNGGWQKVTGGLPPRRELKPGTWAGEGFAPPTEPCPPNPIDALRQCLDAFQTRLADTIQIADTVPWTTPTVRTRYMTEHRQAIISTTAALNAVTNAAGLALQAAMTVGAVVPPLLELTAAGTFQVLYTLQPQQSQTIRIVSWGIDTPNTSPPNLLIRVQAATMAAVQPGGPDPFVSNSQVGAQQPTFAILQADQQLTIEVSMQDLTSPAVVNFGIVYWVFPVNKRIDSREGTRLRDGYGLDCR